MQNRVRASSSEIPMVDVQEQDDEETEYNAIDAEDDIEDGEEYESEEFSQSDTN